MLYRVIKSDSVVFSDVVTRLVRTQQKSFQTAESDIREDEKENTALTNEESVNEDEIWRAKRGLQRETGNSAMHTELQT